MKRLSEDIDWANKLIFVRRYEEALGVLAEALQEPELATSLLTHLRYIELACRLERAEECESSYQRALEEGRLPEDVAECCLALVRQHGSLHSAEAARDELLLVAERYGANAATSYGLGLSYEAIGALDRATLCYEEALKHDPQWFPSYFGLSQIAYQGGRESDGDRYFYLFESAAPYNLYGNFETHRQLCSDFLERGRFDEAEMAIRLLSTWWVENKGTAPAEIAIFERLARARISRARGDADGEGSDALLVEASSLLDEWLLTPDLKDETLSFVALSCEDYGAPELAERCYRASLVRFSDNAEFTARVGQQILATMEADRARLLIEAAWQEDPDGEAIRFYFLIAQLREAGIAVEEYVELRERALQALDTAPDPAQVMAMLYHLLAMWDQDPDVHAALGQLYLRNGMPDKARLHFSELKRLDPRSVKARLRYAAFLLHDGRVEEADIIIEELDGLDRDPRFDSDARELQLLRAMHAAERGELPRALATIDQLITMDPWNGEYLRWATRWRTQLAFPERADLIDATLAAERFETERDNWEDFFSLNTHFTESEHADIRYQRQKITLLLQGSGENAMRAFVSAGAAYDAARAASDLLRLVNTNFDSPWVFWGLAMLHKEVWRLETTIVWLEELLRDPRCRDEMRSQVYVELADTYVWLNQHIEKGIAYMQALDEGGQSLTPKHRLILSHAYLRVGQVQEARRELDRVPDGFVSLELRFLEGLLHYRNGLVSRAKTVWKPLLSTRATTVRAHQIKKELMRYYFDNETYIKTHVS